MLRRSNGATLWPKVLWGRSQGRRTVKSTFAGDPSNWVDQAQGAAVDNIRVTSGTAGPSNPTTVDQCKNGGWVQYGFRNQGLCIQFVNTGKDSR